VIHTQQNSNIQLQNTKSGNDYLPSTCKFPGISRRIQLRIIYLVHPRWQGALTLIFRASIAVIQQLH